MSSKRKDRVEVEIINEKKLCIASALLGGQFAGSAHWAEPSPLFALSPGGRLPSIQM